VAPDGPLRMAGKPGITGLAQKGMGRLGRVKRALKYKPVSSFSASSRNFTLLPPRITTQTSTQRGINQQSRIYCPEYPLPRILVARESINRIPLQRSGESAAGIWPWIVRSVAGRHLCCPGRNIATDVITRPIRSGSVRLNSSQQPAANTQGKEKYQETSPISSNGFLAEYLIPYLPCRIKSKLILRLRRSPVLP
jgi:hypothetical protein